MSPRIEVVVGGDLRPGEDFDELEVSVLRSGAELLSRRFEVGSDVSMPTTLQLERPSGGGGVFELRVAARLGGRRQVEASRELAWSRGAGVEVQLCLWSQCRGSDAPWCHEGACEPPSSDGDGDGDADAEMDGDADTDADLPVLCDDACGFADNGHCEDGGEDSVAAACAFGSDCTDCGERRQDECVRQCRVRECGPDHCGGVCGSECAAGEVCALGGDCVRWVEIAPAGPFTQGSPESEPGRLTAEAQREVTLSRRFAITAREVSQGWFEGLMGVNLTVFPTCGRECPVDSVSWSLAANFTTVLSLLEGLEPCYECAVTPQGLSCTLAAHLSSPYDCDGYRLPTAAEWEYAARAGTATATYRGDLDAEHLECETPNPVLDDIAWFCGTTSPTAGPRERGLLEPNPFGLFDMLGNVGEFVHDRYERFWSTAPVTDPFGPPAGSEREARGGSFYREAEDCRAASRAYADNDYQRIGELGFRVARTLP